MSEAYAETEAPTDAEELQLDPNVEVEVDDAPDLSEFDLEAKARAMGWVPMSEFKGDARQWRPPAQFIDYAENAIGGVKHELRRMKEQNEKLQDRLDQQDRRHQIAMENQKRQLEVEYQRRMEEAVESSNVDEFRRLEAERRQAMAGFSGDGAVMPTAGYAGPSAPVDDIEATFARENDWYGKDTVMTDVAVAESQRLQRQGVTGEANLKFVRTHVEKAFPHRFGTALPNPNRQEPAAVASARLRPNGSKRTRSFDALPQDAKDTFAVLFKQGVWGRAVELKDAQKAYIKDYQWED